MSIETHEMLPRKTSVWMQGIRLRPDVTEQIDRLLRSNDPSGSSMNGGRGFVLQAASTHWLPILNEYAGRVGHDGCLSEVPRPQGDH